MPLPGTLQLELDETGVEPGTSDIHLLLEAEKRSLLDPTTSELLSEARRRGYAAPLSVGGENDKVNPSEVHSLPTKAGDKPNSISRGGFTTAWTDHVGGVMGCVSVRKN